MYGLGYSLKQYFKFSRKEMNEIFWTSLAFAFILTFRKWGSGKNVDLASGLTNLGLALLFVLIAMFAHVSLQKVVAIRLGYTATYSFWLNGLLLCVLLTFLSVGYIVFILPGAVMLQHTPLIRLGKYRFGPNLKDIARVGLAGSMSHVVLIMVIGLFYFYGGHNEWLFAFIIINLFLAVYSLLPVPKIDLPTKMDAGSDGLSMFFFSRTMFVLVFSTIFVYSILVYIAANSYATLGGLFIVAFIIGCILSIAYSISVEQKN